MASNAEKLSEFLKPYGVTGEQEAVQQALAEIAKENSEKKKAAAKDLILKAQELQGQMNAAKKKFENETKKFDKELGKVMNRLGQMNAGQEPTDEEEDKEKEKSS